MFLSSDIPLSHWSFHLVPGTVGLQFWRFILEQVTTIDDFASLAYMRSCSCPALHLGWVFNRNALILQWHQLHIIINPFILSPRDTHEGLAGYVAVTVLPVQPHAVVVTNPTLGLM
jgi:hypothetical protein